MKFILFMFFIPMLSGSLTAVAGISVIDDTLMYLAINAPICALSVLTWIYTD